MAVGLVHVVNDQATQQRRNDEQDGDAHQEPYPCRALALALLGLGVLDVVKLSQLDLLELRLKVAHVVIDMLLVCRREAVGERPSWTAFARWP